MIKSQSLELANVCPREVSCLEIEIENINLPDELRIDQIQNQNHGHHKNDLKNKRKDASGKWERCPTMSQKTVIRPLPPDIKRITGILNKISDENFDKMVEEAKTFNHADPEVVTVIFKKILAEPFFSDVYAKFCNSLKDLHKIVNERCIVEFNKTKHKNLGKFIGELYKLDLLDDLDSFIDALLDNINEHKLETLCKIITTIGVKDPMFTEIIADLNEMKTNFGPRHRFMILDIVENRTNTRSA